MASLAPTITYELDETTLTLRLTVPPDLLPPALLNLPSDRPLGITYMLNTRAFVNYSLNWLDFARFDAFSETGLSVAGKSVIPAFGQITVTFEGEEVLSPIGKSGEFYLENLTSGRFQAKVFTNSPTDSTGTMIFTCTDVGPTDAITIDLSTGSATSYAPRQMRQGSADALNYNLCRYGHHQFLTN